MGIALLPCIHIDRLVISGETGTEDWIFVIFNGYSLFTTYTVSGVISSRPSHNRDAHRIDTRFRGIVRYRYIAIVGSNGIAQHYATGCILACIGKEIYIFRAGNLWIFIVGNCYTETAGRYIACIVSNTETVGRCPYREE